MLGSGVERKVAGSIPSLGAIFFTRKLFNKNNVQTFQNGGSFKRSILFLFIRFQTQTKDRSTLRMMFPFEGGYLGRNCNNCLRQWRCSGSGTLGGGGSRSILLRVISESTTREVLALQSESYLPGVASRLHTQITRLESGSDMCIQSVRIISKRPNISDSSLDGDMNLF